MIVKQYIAVIALMAAATICSSARAQQNAVVRAEQQNRLHRHEHIDNAKWKRDIYRHLDLSKEANAPLYQPAQPTDGLYNLLATIFKLLEEGHIEAYEYLDGREAFTPQYRVNFKDVLDRFDIPYTIQDGKISVSDDDIPSPQVQAYYLKETYYLDPISSNLRIATIAICPILFDQSSYDVETIRYPLFWIPYSVLRPYTMRMPVVASSLNNALHTTLDDYIALHLFDGEIYKAGNPGNLSIAQSAATPEERSRESERIERELEAMKKLVIDK